MRRVTFFILVVVVSLVFFGVAYARCQTIVEELGYDGQWKQYPNTEIVICVEEVP